jgi:hypothetical protein
MCPFLDALDGWPWMTGHSEAIVALQLGSLIGGKEATDHEAETKFPKKTQQQQIHPTIA